MSLPCSFSIGLIGERVLALGRPTEDCYYSVQRFLSARSRIGALRDDRRGESRSRLFHSAQRVFVLKRTAVSKVC